MRYREFNPLSQGRGFSSRDRLPGLASIKTALIALLALTIGIVIVRQPVSIPETSTRAPGPVTSRELVALAPAQKLTPVRAEQRIPTEHQFSALTPTGAAPRPATAPEQAPVYGLQMLYPGLERITELESRPVSIALPELISMLDSDDPAIRLAVVESIGDMATTATLPTLTMALSDPNAQIRIAALDALALQDDTSLTGIIETLLYDSDRQVRLKAIDTLADLEQGIAVYSLAGLLGDPLPAVKRSAVGALGEIGGSISTGYLLQMRYDPDDSIRKITNVILREEALRMR